MFGTYPQIASFMQNVDDSSLHNDLLYREPLPAYLRPSFLPPQPWNQGRGKHGLVEDFIMVAEFSELEGPKPLMTIPKDGGANFDQNAFSVRILAVDFQNSTQGFSLSEDAQLVMSDTHTGVYAFVHHLVLYDNTARGFVRPYCIAYITTDQRKLMYFYEELSHQFKKVARYLKYGNKMLFVGDLERHLRDLDYTKNFLLNQVSKMRLRNIEDSNPEVKSVRRNAENELYKALHMIQESNMEIKQILSIFKPLLLDRRLEAQFKLLEEKAFQRTCSSGQDKLSLQDGWYNDLTGLEQLNTKRGSVTEPKISPLLLFKPREYKPVLVKTKKAERFNAPLRGLHELCSWGAKEGMRKLRHIYEYFKRDMTTIELERNESRLFHPNNASISHGQCITGNFLSDVHMNKFDTSDEMEQGWSMLYSYHWGSTGSLDSVSSFKSAFSCPSLSALQDSTPTSYHTYDSQSGHAFLSAPSSPEKEFSLLTNHEYYQGFDEDNSSEKSIISFSLINNEEAGKEDEIDKSSNAEYSDYSQENGNILSDEKETQVRKHIAKSLSQVDSQILDSQQIINNLPVCNPSLPSDLNLSREVLAKNVHVPRKKQMTEIIRSELGKHISMECETPELAKSNFVKSNNLDLVDENSDLKVEDDSTNKLLARSNCLDVFEGSAEKSNFSNENCCQVSSFHGGHTVSSLDAGNAVDLANSGTQSHSTCSLNISENCNSTDPSIETDFQIIEHTQVLHSKIKPASHSNCKIVSTVSKDGVQALKEHSRKINVPISIIKKNELSNLSKSKENEENYNEKCAGLPSTVSATEVLSHDTKTTHAAANSSWKFTNGDVFTSDSVSENTFHSTVADSNKNSSTSKLSNLLSQNHHPYVHQITALTHLHYENVSQVGTINDSSFTRERTESDVSSIITTSSIQELHPNLTDARNGSPSIKDSFQTCGLSEKFEIADREDDYIGISSAHNAGVWKPRCGVYAVGDWINNLAFRRPGFCLSEVLCTYQRLEHVIFSLLCGRPVLVVGPAKMEQEVVKIVNALAVFVPGAGRKCHAVIDWTSQCLRITDLTKLRLVGLCRPERRSADSFIPRAIKRACTVVDIEQRTINAPPYQGQFIMTLLSKKKVLKSDIQLLSYIEWWLMDILAKAFLFFHIFCLGSTGSILYSHSPNDQRDAYYATVSAVMLRLGVKDHDCDIIEMNVEALLPASQKILDQIFVYLSREDNDILESAVLHLTEIVKVSELEPHVWHDVDSGSAVHPLNLQHKACEKFRC